MLITKCVFSQDHMLWERNVGHAAARPVDVGLPGCLVGSGEAVSSQPHRGGRRDVGPLDPPYC